MNATIQRLRQQALDEAQAKADAVAQENMNPLERMIQEKESINPGFPVTEQTTPQVFTLPEQPRLRLKPPKAQWIVESQQVHVIDPDTGEDLGERLPLPEILTFVPFCPPAHYVPYDGMDQLIEEGMPVIWTYAEFHAMLADMKENDVTFQYFIVDVPNPRTSPDKDHELSQRYVCVVDLDNNLNVPTSVHVHLETWGAVLDYWKETCVRPTELTYHTGNIGTSYETIRIESHGAVYVVAPEATVKPETTNNVDASTEPTPESNPVPESNPAPEPVPIDKPLPIYEDGFKTLRKSFSTEHPGQLTVWDANRWRKHFPVPVELSFDERMKIDAELREKTEEFTRVNAEYQTLAESYKARLKMIKAEQEKLRREFMSGQQYIIGECAMYFKEGLSNVVRVVSLDTHEIVYEGPYGEEVEGLDTVTNPLQERQLDITPDDIR